MRFAKNTQHDTSKVLRLPRKMTMDTSKVLRLPRKLQHIFLKTSQKYCACHAKRLSTRSRTRLNVTKCHACHAKRSNQTSETSKKDHLCKTSHRHGHTVLTRTVADGCERLRTVADGCDRERNVERTHPQPPDPQSETGTLATHSGIIAHLISHPFESHWVIPIQDRCFNLPKAKRHVSFAAYQTTKRTSDKTLDLSRGSQSERQCRVETFTSQPFALVWYIEATEDRSVAAAPKHKTYTRPTCMNPWAGTASVREIMRWVRIFMLGACSTDHESVPSSVLGS